MVVRLSVYLTDCEIVLFNELQKCPQMKSKYQLQNLSRFKDK